MICSNTARNAKYQNENLEMGVISYEAKLRCPEAPLVIEMFALFQDAVQTKIEKNNQIINQYELTKPTL